MGWTSFGVYRKRAGGLIPVAQARGLWSLAGSFSEALAKEKGEPPLWLSLSVVRL
jgi:hypothetical protein